MRRLRWTPPKTPGRGMVIIISTTNIIIIITTTTTGIKAFDTAGSCGSAEMVDKSLFNVVCCPIDTGG
ncbi:MAG TPA: hypothetical protein VLH75_06015 [Longimicrobiales bacterium]|nr:hypothetical protein [Longimicrobiales bacterium]